VPCPLPGGPDKDSIRSGHRPVCAVPLPVAAACDDSGVCVAVMLPDSLYAWPDIENGVSFLIEFFEFSYKL